MQLLGYLFIGVFETAGLHYLSKKYLQLKKAAKIQFVLTHAIYILVTVLQVYCVYNAYLNTVVDFIMYIILVSYYNGSLYKKLLICAASEITFILSESIVLLSGQILTGIKFVNDVSFEKYMPLLCCITGLVGFLLIWLIVKLTPVSKFQATKGGSKSSLYRVDLNESGICSSSIREAKVVKNTCWRT